MNTRTLTLSILLLAVVLAPLAMAEEPAPRGPRGGQGRGNFQGRPGGFGGHPGMVTIVLPLRTSGAPAAPVGFGAVDWTPPHEAHDPMAIIAAAFSAVS